MNFNKIVETKNSFYGISDSGDMVVAQRIETKNSFGISNHEPLYIGVSWKTGDSDQLIILDEKNCPVLKTTKIVEIKNSLEGGE
ncbi:MAG: hypothetical protein WC938_01965 [Candidatus Paceibacterota bacterium]